MVIAIASSATACAFDGGADPGDDSGEDADPGDDGSIGDVDGDEVPDTGDNCVDDPNPDQGDEDNDDVGDVCDVCPTEADEHADGDGDGVGDACDPNPGTPGDSIALFDGFAGSALAAGWTRFDAGPAGDPSWTVNAGALIGAAGEDATVMLRQAGGPGDRLQIDVAAFADTLGPGSQESFGVLSDARDDSQDYDLCTVRFDDDMLELWRSDDGNLNYITGEFMNAGAGSYEFRTRTTSGTMCTVNNDSLFPEAALGTGDHVGLRVRGSTVRISYIAVYRSP